MTDENLTVDDIVTKDEFKELQSEIQTIAETVAGVDEDDDGDEEVEEPSTELPEGVVTEDDMPDFEDFTDREQAAEVADQTFMSRMEHLVNEDCDTEVCNSLRDRLGIDPTSESEEGPDHDHDDEGDENEGEEGTADEGTDDEGDGPDRTPFEVV